MSEKREVWKFPISYDAEQVIGLPAGAKILHFDKQGATERGDRLWIWAEVDPLELCHESRTFHFVGTGHPMKPGLTHIGTVLTVGGQFHWHLYEDKGKLE